MPTQPTLRLFLLINTMKRDIHMNANHRHDGAQRNGTCVALVDGRYMAWLLGQNQEMVTEALSRQSLTQVLSALLHQAGVSADVARVYWYTDKADGQTPPDQVVRMVLPHPADGGTSMLRALSADLHKLASRHACDHVLVASDDERLLMAIDDAQLHGVAVHLLADEAARQMDQLAKDDPGWARLLAQADRRIVLHPQAMRDLTQGRAPTGMAMGGAAPTPAPAVDPEVVRVALQEVIDAWWNDEPEDLREDLRDELQASRGLPQELDRHLLLRVRKVLDRTLSFNEKKTLRDLVRTKVLGVTVEE
jgi:hypothetical protein